MKIEHLSSDITKEGGGEMSELVGYPEEIENVFKAEPPLVQPEVGFGFLGVLLRNTKEDTLQCHICGKWYKGLAMHIWQTHKLKSRTYKRKFSLPLRFPLVALSISKKLSQKAKSPKCLKAWMERKHSGAEYCHNKKSRKNLSYARTNIAFQNTKGICEAQILNRFLIVADIVGREPTTDDLKKYDINLLRTIQRRFLTLNNFREKNGYKVIKPSRDNYWSCERIIAGLRAFYQERHSLPSGRNCPNKYLPSLSVIYKRFGSWNRALAKAGF